MSSKFTLDIQNLSKSYHIYKNPRDRLNQILLPNLQRMIGAEQRRYYSEFWALRNVTMRQHRGETIGIIGRNGSGKSTLLQLICGTLSPTNGRIETHGRIAALLELGSGFNSEFTGRDNIYINGAILGIGKKEMDKHLDEIIDFSGISEFINAPLSTYSSGMIVRLAFSVQVATNPEILIVDEALAVGDEKFQRKCYARIEMLKNKGTSILFVSHSANTINELCDRALFLERGSPILLGSTAEVVRAYQQFIYAQPEEQAKLLKEFSTRQNVQTILANTSSKETATVSRETKIDIAQNQILNLDYDLYDEDFKPETTTSYPAEGAKIDYVTLQNTEGALVNVIKSGLSYKIVVSGQFISNFQGVYFGVHIKSSSGLEITGQRFPAEGVYIENIVPHQQFSIAFNFDMHLSPGVYFVGAGIWSKDEPFCAHRVLDALMFRVIAEPLRRSFGYVDLAGPAASLDLTH